MAFSRIKYTYIHLESKNSKFFTLAIGEKKKVQSFDSRPGFAIIILSRARDEKKTIKTKFTYVICHISVAGESQSCC